MRPYRISQNLSGRRCGVQGKCTRAPTAACKVNAPVRQLRRSESCLRNFETQFCKQVLRQLDKRAMPQKVTTLPHETHVPLWGYGGVSHAGEKSAEILGVARFLSCLFLRKPPVDGGDGARWLCGVQGKCARAGFRKNFLAGAVINDN